MNWTNWGLGRGKKEFQIHSCLQATFPPSVTPGREKHLVATRFYADWQGSCWWNLFADPLHQEQPPSRGQKVGCRRNSVCRHADSWACGVKAQCDNLPVISARAAHRALEGRFLWRSWGPIWLRSIQTIQHGESEQEMTVRCFFQCIKEAAACNSSGITPARSWQASCPWLSAAKRPRTITWVI